MFKELFNSLRYGLLTAVIVSGLVLWDVFNDVGGSIISAPHYIVWFSGAVLVLTPTLFVLQHIVLPKDYISWSSTYGGALGLVLYVHWGLLHWWGPTPFGLNEIINVEEIGPHMIFQMMQWQVAFLVAAFFARQAVSGAWEGASA